MNILTTHLTRNVAHSSVSGMHTHLFTDMIILLGYSLMDTLIYSHMHVHSLIQTNILQPPFTLMKCSYIYTPKYGHITTYSFTHIYQHSYMYVCVFFNLCSHTFTYSLRNKHGLKFTWTHSFTHTLSQMHINILRI